MSAEPPVMERVTDEPVSSSAPAPPAPPEPTTVNDILANVRSEFAQQEPPAVPQPAPEPTPEPAPGQAPPPAAEPAPVAEPEPVIPAPESSLAPIFALGSDDEAVRTATDILSNLRYDDPIAFDNLSNGVYYANEKRFQAYALNRLGIPQEKVQEFVAWAQSGQDLPRPASAVPPFPEPDSLNEVEVNGVRLDLSIPEHKLAYENARKLYDIDAREEARKVQEQNAESVRRADEQKQVMEFHDDCFDTTANAYLDERTSLIKSLVQPAVANLAPEDKILGEMFEAFVEQRVQNAEEVRKIGQQARELMVAVVGDTVARCQRAGYSSAQIKNACVARLKEGRMLNYAAAQDKILRQQIATYRNEFSNMILRRNRAELAATATSPVVPQNAQTVSSVTPPLNNGQPQTLQEILADARRYDQQVAAAQRQ